MEWLRKLWCRLGLGHWPNGKTRLPPGASDLPLEDIHLRSNCRFCRKAIIQDSQGNWF